MNVELYPAGIVRVLNEPPAAAALHGRADRAVTEAKATGPRNPRHHTHVIDAISVGDTRTGPDGATVDIDWGSSVWYLIEFGSKNNQPYRPVTRAAQNAGLRVLDKRSRA